MPAVSKSPAYRWYPKDFEGDEFCRSLPRDVRDLYRQLLDWAWLELGIPEDDEAIYDHVHQRGDSDGWLAEAWSMVRLKFVPNGRGRLVNPRMERERERQKAFADKQREKGKRRWAKDDELLEDSAKPENSRGSNPANVRQCLLGNVNANESSEGLVLNPEPDRVEAIEPAKQVLAAVNEGRKRVIPGARQLSPTDDNLKHIRARLKQNSLEDCLHVVSICEAETHANPDVGQWFNAVSPFIADNFGRKVAKTATQARGSPSPKSGRGEVSKPTKTGTVDLRKLMAGGNGSV